MKNALILEDSITALAALVPVVRKAGYDVHKAVSIQNAIQVLCMAEFQLVILDVSVPEAPGKAVGYAIDIIKLARALSPNVRVIVWSANDKHRSAAEAHGATFFRKEQTDALLASIQ